MSRSRVREIRHSNHKNLLYLRPNFINIHPTSDLTENLGYPVLEKRVITGPFGAICNLVVDASLILFHQLQ